MIRPIEPTDAEAVRALLSRPEVARWSGDHPFLAPSVVEKRLASDAHRLGRFEGDELVGMAVLTPSPIQRCRQTATLDLYGDDAELLLALLETADRWLGFVRVEREIDAEDPVRGLLREAGFRVEVHKRRSRLRDGARVDTLVMGRICPIWSPTNFTPPPHPPWPAPSQSPADVRIRATTPADAEAFAALHRDPTVVWGTYQLPTATAAGWRARLQKNDSAEMASVCAEVGGVIVGSAGVFLQPHPRRHAAWLGMSVAAAWQGKGIGRKLLNTVVDAAESWLSASRIELEAWATNTRALELYRSAGFEIEGIRRCAGWQDGDLADSVVMARVKG